MHNYKQLESSRLGRNGDSTDAVGDLLCPESPPWSRNLVGDNQSHRKEVKFNTDLVPSLSFTVGTRVTMCRTFVGQPDA